MKNVEEYRGEVSNLAKKLNKVRKECTKYMIKNTTRKRQLTKFSLLIAKLISENRITKEEVAQFLGNKKQK